MFPVSFDCLSSIKLKVRVQCPLYDRPAKVAVRKVSPYGQDYVSTSAAAVVILTFTMLAIRLRNPIVDSP